jgi:hypothetical protein
MILVELEKENNRRMAREWERKTPMKLTRRVFISPHDHVDPALPRHKESRKLPGPFESRTAHSHILVVFPRYFRSPRLTGSPDERDHLTI